MPLSSPEDADMAEKTVLMVARKLELGWSGSKGGRTIEFVFKDGTKKLGTLQVGAAALRWRGPYERNWRHRIPVAELDDLFRAPPE